MKNPIDKNSLYPTTIADYWRPGGRSAPCVIAPNNFVHKSLSNWALNFAVGCGHGCLYCYVPSTSVNKMSSILGAHNVSDPDAQWGDYVFLREWDERKFLASLRLAENTPLEKLNPDGNRAILLCSTTDSYQVVRGPDAQKRRELQQHLEYVVRRALVLIRDHSTLNVRILTRGPLVRRDFDILETMGDRVLLGMSIPTLRLDLAKIYEPSAPAPSQRLATLKAAADRGIPVFVAIAPTYPECDVDDIRATMTAIKELNPVTVYHEPINIRAENVARIEAGAQEVGIKLRTEVFANSEAWRRYALGALRQVEAIAGEVGFGDRLHLWPDAALGTQAFLKSLDPISCEQHLAWLKQCWARVSEWPGKI